MDNNRITLKRILDNIGRKHLVAIVLSIVLSGFAICYIGQTLYKVTRDELQLRGEMDVIQSAERFDAYLLVDKNALSFAGYTVNNMLVKGASTDEILAYMVVRSDEMINELDKSFTGLYGWIDGQYLDGAGWVPDDDYVATERPWYKAAAGRPREIVFVDPYVDLQTGTVMMTISELLDDGESVIALDIGLGKVQEIADEIAADTPGAKVMVLDSSDVAIAHSDHDKIGTDYSDNSTELEGLVVEQINRDDKMQFSVDYNGHTYMTYMRHLEGGWHCVSMIDTGVFYRPLSRVIFLTLALGLIAMALILLIFYNMSLRELNIKNLHVQIKAAADIYCYLLDINLADDSYYDISSNNSENAGQLHSGAQAMMKEMAERQLDDSVKPFMLEFIDLSTIAERLSDTDTITVEFLRKNKQWCRGRFICAERDADGKAIRVLWGTENINEEKLQKDHLRHLSETDLMTGINNSVTGEFRINELLNNGTGGMFVLFDIDNFKSFNDRFGHNVGDKVIVAVANCLKNSFRSDDVVMRLGGDEFVAFAAGVHSRDAAERILKRFYDDLANVVVGGLDVDKISVSAGVSFSPDGDTADFRQLYESADRCMYESKKISDNQITYG